MIPDEAVEAAAKALEARSGSWDPWKVLARIALEAAAPILLSHQRQLTADAHRDAMVNRETKRADLAQAWEEGYQSREQEEQPYWAPNPYRSQA